MMSMPTPFQVINPTVQNTMGGAHLHTPQSIFQHMMGQQNTSHEPGSWNQLPQVPPMCMPWSVQNLQQPHIVKFTGENKVRPCDPVIHQKRKLDVTDVVTMRPTKQFISEEKMAAHFNDMHISSNYIPTAVPSTSRRDDHELPMNNQVEMNLVQQSTNSGDLEDGKSMHPRLVISEELKRLQQEPLLPASLLSKLERPSMALVLWEPPSKHLGMFAIRTESSPQIPRTNIDGDNDSNNNNNDNNSNNNNDSNSSSSRNSSSNSNNYNNNNVHILDLNQSGYDSHNTELEPMDL